MTSFTGKLVDVFELTGRGPVAVVEMVSGTLFIGDSLQVGDRSWLVHGVEAFYNSEWQQRIKEGWVPPLGVLLWDATKQELFDWIGEPVMVTESRSVEPE